MNLYEAIKNNLNESFTIFTTEITNEDLEERKEFIRADYPDMDFTEEDLYRDIADSNWDLFKEEDLPKLNAQINKALILKGSNKTWNRDGEGFMAVSEVEDLFDGYDDVTLKSEPSGVTFSGTHHDGGTWGTLYTLKDENETLDFLKKYLDDEEFDMYYFFDSVDSDVLNALFDKGLLKPLMLD